MKKTYHIHTRLCARARMPIRALTLALTLIALTAAGCASSKATAPRDTGGHGARAYRHFSDGEIPQAIAGYKRGYAAARRADDGTGAARNLSNIGRAYYELGRPDSAALYFAKAHEEFVIYKDEPHASKTAAFLALCFAKAGDRPQAEHWWNTAITSVNMDNPKSNRHYYAVIRGQLDFKLTNNISDINALNAAHAFYRKQKNHAMLSAIYTLKADAEFAGGNCAAADRYLQNALSSNQKTREMYRRSGILLRLSQISFCDGDERMGRHYYERARDSAPKGATVPPMDEVSLCKTVCRR